MDTFINAVQSLGKSLQNGGGEYIHVSPSPFNLHTFHYHVHVYFFTGSVPPTFVATHALGVGFPTEHHFVLVAFPSLTLLILRVLIY